MYSLLSENCDKLDVEYIWDHFICKWNWVGWHPKDKSDDWPVCNWYNSFWQLKLTRHFVSHTFDLSKINHSRICNGFLKLLDGCINKSHILFDECLHFVVWCIYFSFIRMSLVRLSEYGELSDNKSSENNWPTVKFREKKEFFFWKSPINILQTEIFFYNLKIW